MVFFLRIVERKTNLKKEIDHKIFKKELINFYKKNDWKKLNKKSINLVDRTFISYGMIYNNKDNNEKYFFYINK